MDRRIALMALSGAAAALAVARPGRVALAQTAAAPLATAATLGQGAYVTQTLMVGTASKQTSQLALTRATNPKVREFALFEVAEQTAVAQVLTNAASPPPAALDPTYQQMLTRLGATAGKAFDAAYVLEQIQGHEELLKIQQAFLNGVPTDHDREHIAVLARTVIQMHLTMLQDLQAITGEG